LRIDNKVYLYFNNISVSPFAILNTLNSYNDAEITFENVVLIEYLDIIFKDQRDNILNFYNMHHYLNIQISIHN